MSGSLSKRSLRVVAAVVIIVIVIGAGVLAYHYYSSSSSSTGSSPVVVGTMSSSTVMTEMTTTSSSPLILYSADAYVAESTTLENAFTLSTGIMMVPPKSAGSLVLAQQISQGNPVSVFISVSRSAVQPLYLKNESSGWAIEFASDQMALAYTNASLQSSNAKAVFSAYTSAVASNTTAAWNNFFSILSSGSVKIGISDPNADPAGYRAWIVLEAASQAYAGNQSFFGNKILSNKGNVTGASAADLVGPLQTGQIQFLFIYKSAATADKLNYLQLPDQVNLGNPADSSFYSKFSYQISTGVQKGGLIALFITVPADSTDTADSLQFVVFVVKNSSTLLSPFGLVPLRPPQLYVTNSTTIPAPLQQLVTQGYLQPSGPL